jgi:hypothetical protein
MVSEEAVREDWFKRTDVFEIIHYLSQYEDAGLRPGEIKELRERGTTDEIEALLEALNSVGVVQEEDEDYFLDFDVFPRVAQERWIEPLSDKQRDFIRKFCRKYTDDRDHGSVRAMITDSMVHGIFSRSKEMDEEIVKLAHQMNFDKEGFDRPGIYAELAMRELSE